jgi:hypothetical protein
MWLKVWFSKLEAAELENYGAFEVTEEEDEDVINESIGDLAFRMPTASDISNAYHQQTASDVERKVSSSSTCSSASFQSSIPEEG